MINRGAVPVPSPRHGVSRLPDPATHDFADPLVQEGLGHASLKTALLCVQLAGEDMDRQLREHVL